MNRLKEKYNKEIRAELQKELSLKNPLSVPQIKKVVINAGLPKSKTGNKAFVDTVFTDLSKIAGQQAVKRNSRKSIAGFKIRENELVGAVATLRGERMYDFLDKLISIALPRVRDFRGLDPDAFDEKGNYNIGLREQTVFPEISDEAMENTFGLQITVVISGGEDNKGRVLLTKFGFPFNQDKE
jgi:large subunit ribosomal protein L5